MAKMTTLAARIRRRLAKKNDGTTLHRLRGRWVLASQREGTGELEMVEVAELEDLIRFLGA